MIRTSISTLTRAACAALSAVVLLSGCGEEKKPAETAAAAEAAKIHVGVVQLVEHEALDATVKGFIDVLAERGFKDGEKITIDHQNAQGDQTTLANIGNRFVSDKVQLIFASSTPAVQAMARATKTIPVVATAVTSFEAARVVKSDKEPGGNVTGVSNLGPIAAQMALLVEMTGDATKTEAVGVIYNPSEVNAEYQVEKFRQEAKARGIRLVEASASNVNDIPQAMNSMRGKVCSLWLPTDNVLASGAATVAKLARDMKLPVFASDSALVRAGSLASISVNYYELGRMSGALGADILEGKKKPATTPIAFQDAQKPLINLTTAEAIGFKISPEVLNRSETMK
ncbi:ABC transporter substrate-binding protein [Sutterella sp.]|uniref:ABC transporter substrate-binding protein n=1 Tax=Sutterella sp. TaxID=1981025 RepID=UPI0026E001EB|nr:ABC transporter substrate-binding protein [Sutterella sp.]MDO5531647.1 ABC transporter substrate-binding protein [Sutterella sp.]